MRIMHGKDCEMPIRFRGLGGWVALALLAAPVAAQSQTLELWREAVVTGDDVRLGDICRVDTDDTARAEALAGTVVAVAPIPGGSLVITADELRRTLSADGVNLARIVLKGSAECAVTRPRQIQAVATSPGSESTDQDAESTPRCLREIITRYFELEVERSDVRVKLRFGRSHADALDLCEPRFRFRIERTSARATGTVGVRVGIYEDEVLIREFPMLVEVTLFGPAVVAARAINLGAIIRSEDLRVVETALDGRAGRDAVEPAALVGQRAKHFIAAGKAVHLRDVERVPLVKRGQLVDVVSRVGGVTVVTAAQALEEGTHGDVVALRADGRERRRFQATVSGAGRVQTGPARTLARGDN
jgi:flagella basal body P-ring formation protein FlgA